MSRIHENGTDVMMDPVYKTNHISTKEDKQENENVSQPKVRNETETGFRGRQI